MPTHKDQVTDPLYWNWVKGGLGLKYLTEGLESFVDDTLKSVQTDFFDDILKNTPGLQEVKCTECTTANVLSCPTTGMCNIRKRGKISVCSYHDKTDKLKTSRPCPNSICDKIRLKIHTLHRYEDPSWKNTNAQNWCSNHFEIGKCFFPKSGYEDKTATSQTDSSGILNMSINCLPIQKRLDVYINPPNDILSRLLKTRNSIFHSTSCHLTKVQLDSYIDEMVKLLEDKETLLADPRAKSAVLKLTQLKQSPFHISPKDELEVRNEALRAVEEKKNNAIQEIQDKQEEVIELIKETHAITKKDMSEEMTAHTETMASQCDALRSSIQTLKSTQDALEGNIENHELRLIAIEHTLTQLKTLQDRTEDFSDLKDDMKATNTIECLPEESKEYLKRKRKLQNKLCEMYKSHIESIPLSPVMDGLDASVDDLFVELVICDDKIHEPRTTNKTFKANAHDSSDKTHEPKSYGKKVEGYTDILVRTTYECKNKNKHKCRRYCEEEEREFKCKNMYVIGDAGMGKTTWCMKMVSSWVDALMTDDKTTDGRGECSDASILSEIDLLLFVSLRHAVNDGDIISMVTHQLFEEFPEMDRIAKDVLKTEPQTCLLILDGLDEWQPPMDFKLKSSLQHPGLPGRKDLYGCPILTTTRPWKLDEVRLSNIDIDRAVKIKGLKNHHSLIRTVICYLKDTPGYEGNLKHRGKRDFVLAFEEAFKTSLGSDDSSDNNDDDDNSSYDDDNDDNDDGNDGYDNNDGDNKDDDDACLSSYDRYEGTNPYMSNISFYRIPLILVFMVCLWYDGGKLEKTWAANFTGLIDFLIQIAERPSNDKRPGRLSLNKNLQDLQAKWSESSIYLPDSLSKIKRLTNYSELILKLSKFAFESLFTDSKESTLVFTEESLGNEFNSDELDVALKIGLISQSKVVGKTLKRLTSMSFMHKSLQELFAALFLVWKTETDDKTALNKYISYCRMTKDIKEMENVLLFVCGLSSKTASEMSRHVADVTQYDLKDDLLDLKIKCVLEMQAAYGPSYPSEECPIFTFGMDMESHQNEYIIQKLAEINIDHLVSLYLRILQLPKFLSDMTQLQELTLNKVFGSVHQNDTLDLSQLRDLKTINLTEIDWKCIVRLDVSNLKNIIMVHCRSIEIKTLSNCQIAKETINKENNETVYKMKGISLIDCIDCKMSVEGVISTIDNVRFGSCDSCQFTMLACKETHGARTTSTEQRSNIHNLVIDKSNNLTLNISNEVEVIRVQIRDYQNPFMDKSDSINLLDPIAYYIRQLPKLKQIDIKPCLFADSSHFMLSNEAIHISIPKECIEKIRHHSNIVHLRLHENKLGTNPGILIDILPHFTKLKSFEMNGTVTKEVLNILTNICIERLVLYVYDEFEEIAHFFPRIRNLLYLNLTDIHRINYQHLSNMLLHMPQLKTLSISVCWDTVGINDRNEDHVAHSDKNVKELQLEEFSMDFGVRSSADKLPTPIVNYLKHCCHLKDLSCQTHVLVQLVSESELKPILTHVETFKSKGKGRMDVLLVPISKMSNIRYVDLRRCDDFNQLQFVFVNLEHLETLKLRNVFLNRIFFKSLPVTRQPITIEIADGGLDYDVEQYLRSRQWLQSVERTMTYKYNAETNNKRMVTYEYNHSFSTRLLRVHNIKFIIWKRQTI